jgi:hypothetical protein
MPSREMDDDEVAFEEGHRSPLVGNKRKSRPCSELNTTIDDFVYIWLIELILKIQTTDFKFF